VEGGICRGMYRLRPFLRGLLVLLFFFLTTLAEEVGVVGVDGWDAKGKTVGTEGDFGRVSVPFPAELGRESSILSDSDDLD
jgi:hypothetical protein